MSILLTTISAVLIGKRLPDNEKPIIREFETERSQDVVIMLDTGRLMASPILLEATTLPSSEVISQKAMLKLDYAINYNFDDCVCLDTQGG